MEISGFNENDISEQNKESLQSETWQEVRKAVKTEIRHFADELLKDDPYGYPWERVVDAYLKSGYKEEETQYELTVLGSTYKVLKREEVTAFYDANGNTLFDVVNERLEKEYEWLMNDNTKADTEITNPEDGKHDVAGKENVKTVKQRAQEKLEKERKAAKDKFFADPVIGYLLKRCEEDEGLAQDVVQEHKTWKKCFDYLYRQARKQTKGSCAAVRDDVVYEWAEDYYHKDDKAEEEKKAQKAAERKKNQEERAKKAKSEPNKAKAQKSKEEPKPKKNNSEMDGQLDMFSMMGM